MKKINTLAKYFIFKGWKTSLNPPKDTSAPNKLAYDVWNNCLSPDVKMEDAIKWVAVEKEMINNGGNKNNLKEKNF